MSRITDLTILQELFYGSKTYGLYWCKFEGKHKLFTRSGDDFKVLMHTANSGDQLHTIRDDVVSELLRELETLKPE
jgi:hypothetical protein